MEIDLMYYRGNVFLLGVLTPLEYSICLPIKDRGVLQITKAVKTLLTESKAKGFNVRVVKSDNEGLLSTAEMAHLLAQRDIMQDHTAPGQHAARAERRIRSIKQKARSITCQFPYEISKEMSKHAIIAANSFTNMQKATSSESPLSPRENFFGRQTGYKRDACMPFGSYCQCATPNTSSGPANRTEA